MAQEGGGSRARIVVAGTSSGAGKTTVTIGLMAALRRRGMQVQGFKCGPDYIDPTYHTAVTGRPSRNLDSWMVSAEIVRETYWRGSAGADVSVIEGVMGLCDGKDPLSEQGSTAEIAQLLDAPVLLVVNVQSMARSAAAVVLGFMRLCESTRIAGVIANRCGSEGHYQLVKAAIESVCGIPVVGWLAREPGMEVPERHLGLVPAIERGELSPLFERAADAIERGVDLDAVLALARSAAAMDEPVGGLFDSAKRAGQVAGEGGHGAAVAVAGRPVIAVARDAAFHFYYPENLELLEAYGAELRYFSPLAGEPVPAEADGVYIGGGFPEEFAAALAGHRGAMDDLKRRAEAGLPVYAECGGYMYLARSITDRAGATYDMVGLVPAHVRMKERLAALGYREATALRETLILGPGESIRGHEFHYSELEPDEEDGEDGERYPYAYESAGRRGVASEGFTAGSVTAGYTHVHFGSNPQAAQRLVARCREFLQLKAEIRS